ncbi:MAG TPA: hypothetical protein VH436_14885 [Vicinamibacterales bacterium]|jgi:hypothetical protein
MNRVSIGLGALLVVVTAIVSAQQPQRPADASKGLRIVVLEGEDAVNIVQQKTAVRPVVEVRDSNNLPVAGVTVQFTIARSGGGAAASFANGQSVVTVTTDAVGRAATSPLQAIGNGAVRINVQATYQGQVATATVSQTNFASAAEAARAGRTPTPSTGGGAGTGAGAGGAGGAAGSGAAGAVATTAAIGAAGLSGAIAANEIKKENDSCRSSADTFSADLSAALDACVISTVSAQCQSASQTAAASLGAWCTCDGAATVDAQLRAEGSSLTELQNLAGFPRVTFPASCR